MKKGGRKTSNAKFTDISGCSLTNKRPAARYVLLHRPTFHLLASNYWGCAATFTFEDKNVQIY